MIRHYSPQAAHPLLSASPTLHHVKYRSASEGLPSMRFVRRVSSPGGACLLVSSFATTQIMKKSKLNSGQGKRKSTAKVAENKDTDNTKKANVEPDPLDDEDRGFGGWLRSTDGAENMKLFVLANSIVMLTTIVYPHLQTTIEIIYDMIYGPDTLY